MRVGDNAWNCAWQLHVKILAWSRLANNDLYVLNPANHESDGENRHGVCADLQARVSEPCFKHENAKAPQITAVSAWVIAKQESRVIDGAKARWLVTLK